MKKILCILALLFTFAAALSVCKAEIPETWYRWDAEIDTISIHASDCSVEILPSYNNYMTYRSNEDTAINVASIDNTLFVTLTANAVVDETLPIIYLSLPLDRQYNLEIYTTHANVSLPDTTSNILANGNDHSHIRILINNTSAHIIQAEISNESHLELDLTADATDYRLDCSVLDHESHLDIDGKYGDLIGKGEYHYIKGSSATKLHITLNSNSSLALTTQTNP